MAAWSPRLRLRCSTWFLPLCGLPSLIWFLLRVIPKPSRAAYPCQRAAFPLASGFVLWLAGMYASLLGFRRARAWGSTSTGTTRSTASTAATSAKTPASN
ncbi:MAG: hypothetical protein FJY95_01605 [Candidatus Handelsmanbacteria bacterium]|nr:hypothetical protein [Candidatus Handelsmanbacteria bacterium]